MAKNEVSEEGGREDGEKREKDGEMERPEDAPVTQLAVTAASAETNQSK